MFTTRSRSITQLSTLVAIALTLASGCSSNDNTSAAATASQIPTTESKATVPAPTTAPSTVPAPTTTSSTLPGKLGLYPSPIPGNLPDGDYVVDITDADLAAVGEPNLTENHGHYVITLARGVWSYVQTAANPLQNPTDTGTYEVAADHVKFFGATDDPGEDFVWVANADGSLKLTAQPSTQRTWAAFLGSHDLVPAS